ncbi:MAG TPA: phosphatidylglycerophosphatase A [Bacteroidota bacterium]|nr:phosphatidylglycerophosphatase A [Bacteroidota bacterium]
MSGSVPPPEGRRSPFLVRLVATGLYSGYAPWASGTVGSAVGLLLFLIPGAWELRVLLPLIVAFFFAGVYASGVVAREEGHRLTKTAAAAKAMFQKGEALHPDPSIVVIDEIVGMWIALAGIAPGAAAALSAFLLFRAFDILKPEPAGRLERLGGGWGIMLDDVVAGIYANAGTRVILTVIPLLHRGGAS